VFFTGNLYFAYVAESDETSFDVRYACYLKNSVLDVKYPGSYTRLIVSRGLLHEPLILISPANLVVPVEQLVECVCLSVSGLCDLNVMNSVSLVFIQLFQ